MTTGKALNGKPYAGNPHVRFDEGEVAPAATPRRGSLLYKIVRFWLAAASLGAASLACASAADAVLPTHVDSPWLRVRAAEIARTAPVELAAARQRLAEIAPELERAFADAPAAIERERTMKRLEIARDLCGFVEDNIAAGDLSSLQFAERGLDDLRLFQIYFRQELTLWKSNPDNPSVKPVVVNAADYGVRGDGKTPNGDAFARCFDAVRALGGRPCVVKVPAGEYYFDKKLIAPGSRLDAQFCMSYLTNAVLEGESPETTRFSFGVYDTRGGLVDDCENAKVRNLQFAWRKYPFAEGMTLEADSSEGSCVMEMNKLCMRPDDSRLKSCLTSQFEPDGRFCFDSSFAWLDPQRPAEDLGGGKFKIYFERKKFGESWKKVKAGRIIYLPDRKSDYLGLGMVKGHFITLDSVWCRNSRAAAFSTGIGSRQTTVVCCRIFPNEGCTLSTCADGYFTSCGSYFAHSDFTHMHDDGNNSHSCGSYVESQEGDDTLYFVRGRIPRPKAGDLMLLASPLSGQYIGNVRVKEDAVFLTKDGKPMFRVRFESLPEGLNSFASLGMKSLSREEQQEIIFNRKKVERMPDHIYQPGAGGVGSVITGCRISSLRGTAVPSQAPNELIESNVVYNVGSGIRLCGLVQWMEGPPPYHAIVRGNEIRECGDSLLSMFQMPNHGPAATAPIRGCRFEGNRIVNPVRTALQFRNLGHSVVRDNEFIGESCKIEMRRCEKVVFEGNTLNGKPFAAE